MRRVRRPKGATKVLWQHLCQVLPPKMGNILSAICSYQYFMKNVHELPVDAFVYENCSINVDTMTEFCTGPNI